ncbi:MAG TPA: DNA methyltransferase [Candidatus Saccharimonadia bacterium]|nr:DNA methyltransferase [Candidatus Saccharimonadia bacterium]
MSSLVSRQHQKKLLSLHEELRRFDAFGKPTSVTSITHGKDFQVPIYVNEFWTSKQRAANRLHEISYRACFKPQLPRFFIERLTNPADVVFDPFMGRGTTLLEAALIGRVPFGCDANPLCEKLIAPRLCPPTVSEVQRRLETIAFDSECACRDDLLVFYHPRTLRQLHALRNYLADRRAARSFDSVDAWIQMVAINRLTGHSKGFFSVYTLPPNQAVSLESQRKINQRLKQRPDFRPVSELILAKSKSLLRDMTPASSAALWAASRRAKVLTTNCESVPELSSASVDLVATSPPFLNVVDYAADNWLRCWFIGMEKLDAPFEVKSKLPEWEASMTRALKEVHRILKPGGWVAFEVGEIQRGKVRLEETVIPAGLEAGLCPTLVLINSQEFTKTANCWGVSNNDLGTNTNRIVLFHKRS